VCVGDGRCSYLEIYNESVMDLLAAEGTAALTIRDDARRGVHVEGATEEPVTGPLATYQLFTRGSANRRVGETAMNRESSRSHRYVVPYPAVH
jgi:hypothetical protein